MCSSRMSTRDSRGTLMLPGGGGAASAGDDPAGALMGTTGQMRAKRAGREGAGALRKV